MFLLLLAPTSSVVPIFDVSAERRMYLPFLGLVLVCLEFLRRLKVSQAAAAAGVAILAVCCVLTYQRSQVWASPVALWQDASDKSPRKWRPHFQLASAFFESGNCPWQRQHSEAASRLPEQPAFDLLVDWALALDCEGDWQKCSGEAAAGVPAAAQRAHRIANRYGLREAQQMG